jgi:hypothetical protein
MNHHIPHITNFALFLVFGAIAVGTLFVMKFYRWNFGFRRKGGFLWAIASVTGAIVAAIAVSDETRRLSHDEQVSMSICSGLLVLAGVPYLIKLYQGWIGGHVTEPEKATGATGFKAWLSAPNLILSVVIAVCAAKGFDYPFAGVLLVCLMGLIAYPALTTLRQSADPADSIDPAESLTAEREKVLGLLEAGKITAEESVELLNALGSTIRSRQREGLALSGEHRVMLVGAALVLMGFFLPWFTINPGKELNRLEGQLQNQMGQFMAPMMQGQGGLSVANVGDMFGFNFNMTTMSLNGGDVKHGLGWMILLMSVGAAGLPLVWPQGDAHIQRTVSLVALGAGTALLLYLTVEGVRFLNVGLVVAAAGYCVQWAGLIKRGGLAPMPGAIREHA